MNQRSYRVSSFALLGRTSPGLKGVFLVNGALIRSVAIESEDADTVIATRLELRLGDCENISYPLAIARIMGLSPVPDEDTYG